MRTFLIVLLLTSWWFARNYTQTGDFIGLRDYQSAWVGEADRARLIREALSGLPYAWTTFWARFDYGQVVLPEWVYGGAGVVCVLAVAGLLWARREFGLPGLLIVVLAILVSLAGWGALMITIPATANARLIFQIFPALGLLFALGVNGYRTDKRILCPTSVDPFSHPLTPALITSTLFFAFALFALVGYLAPAFAYPRTVGAIDATPASANFEGAAEIVGYRIAGVDLTGFQKNLSGLRPGDRVDVTVYWRPLAQTAAPLQVFVHFVDSQGIIVAQRDTYPGLGKAITTSWRVGQTFADTYRVFIPNTAYAPEALTVRVGLWSIAENRPLIANDSDALELGAIALLDRVGNIPNPVSVNFANKMALVGYELDARVLKPGGTILLTTYWRPVAPEADYWAYAHVVGADGRIWAIADSIITPPITEWPPGEVRSETRQLVLTPDTPPGQYVVEFGLTKILNPGQERLSVLAEDGHEVGDHIELAKIRVEP